MPSTISLEVGTSEQAVDPVNENCTIMWHTEISKNLECKSISMADHTVALTRPATTYAWAIFAIGKYFYFKLEVNGVGGAFSYFRGCGLRQIAPMNPKFNKLVGAVPANSPRIPAMPENAGGNAVQAS